MQVLKTTSPSASAAQPPRSPRTTNPSSSTRARGSANRHLRVVDHPVVTNRDSHSAAEPGSGHGGVAATTEETVGLHRPGLGGIDEDPVRRKGNPQDGSGQGDAGTIEDRPGQPQGGGEPRGGFRTPHARGGPLPTAPGGGP